MKGSTKLVVPVLTVSFPITDRPGGNAPFSAAVTVQRIS